MLRVLGLNIMSTYSIDDMIVLSMSVRYMRYEKKRYCSSVQHVHSDSIQVKSFLFCGV